MMINFAGCGDAGTATDSATVGKLDTTGGTTPGAASSSTTADPTTGGPTTGSPTTGDDSTGGAGDGPFIDVREGQFYDGDQPWRMIGVNYWPHYMQPYYHDVAWDWVLLWGSDELEGLDAEAEIAADFARMAENGITELRTIGPEVLTIADRDPATYPTADTSFCARFGRVLDLAGEHGLHITLIAPSWNYGLDYFEISATQEGARARVHYLLRAIDACGLSSREELLGYTLSAEDALEGGGDGGNRRRATPLAIGMWNDWLTSYYGNLASAEQHWGETLVRECAHERAGILACADALADEKSEPCQSFTERACPPRAWSLQGQTGQPPAGETATPRAARDYVRFLGWVTNQAFWRMTGEIRARDPNHLITVDAILTDDYCSPAYYVARRDTIKYIDFSSIHLYHFNSQRTAFIETLKAPELLDSLQAAVLWKSAAAIAYMAPELRPVVAGEYGFSVTACPDPQSELCMSGDTCKLCLNRPAAEREAFQAALALFDARIFAAGGAIGHRWWWWRGERPMGTKSSKGSEGGRPSDYGALTPDGTARPVLASIAPAAAAYDAIAGAPVETAEVDDAASACTGRRLDAVYDAAVAAVADDHAFRVATQCTGEDSTNAPLTCVSGSPHACFADAETCCPTLCLDAMFEAVEVLDHAGAWTSAREGDPVTVKAGAPVQLRVRVGNLGETRWLAATPGSGQVKLALTGPNLAQNRVALPGDIGALESTPVLEFTAIEAIAADTAFTIHMVAEGRAFFGERRTIALVVE